MKQLLDLVELPLVLLNRLVFRKAHICIDQPNSIGENLETEESFILNAKALSRHCYLLGSTGCGKTTTILKLIEQDLQSNHSIIVLDLRGDLVQGALSLCAKQRVPIERVTLLDLREKEYIQGFSPLSGAGEAYIRALHVLDVLSHEADSWGVQLEETLRSALLVLAESKQPITRLSDLLFDESFLEKSLLGLNDETAVAFWERYLQMSVEKRQTWALPVMNKVTTLLATPTLREILSKTSSLNLNKVLSQRGSILLVSLAVDELHRTSRMMGSLIVSAIAREMMARVNLPENRRNPVRLYIDEFENMASESFESIVAEGRRFKLSLVLSHQTLSQLPAKLRSVIRNNVGLQIIYQCGYEDATQISKELPAGIEASEIRSLTVGQAYVADRSGDASLIQFEPLSRSSTSAETDTYRHQVLSRLPKAQVRTKPKKQKTKSKASKIDMGDWL